MPQSLKDWTTSWVVVMVAGKWTTISSPLAGVFLWLNDIVRKTLTYRVGDNVGDDGVYHR